MSDWRRKQGPASFRGVPFYTEAAERSGGRHAVVHEYPFSEKPAYTEDDGRKNRRFSVDGYVLGTEYTTARDALITALETPGPGELVHPYFGARRVVVESFRVRESRDEGGVARFSIECSETVVEAPAPTAAVDTRAALVAAVGTASASVSSRFLAAYDDASALRDSVAGALRRASLAVGSVLDRASLEAQANASLRARLTALSNNAVGLVNAPADLLSSVAGVVEALASGLLGSGIPNPSGALLALYSAGLGDRPPETTASRAVERANFDATQYLFRRLVLVQAALVAIDQTFASYEDAIRTRAELTVLLDEHLDEVTDDVFPALTDLRAALVAAVPGEASDLPRLERYTPPVTVPSLVLAHRLYGNLDLERDLVERNKIKNPGFVPGGVELEILSRG